MFFALIYSCESSTEVNDSMQGKWNIIQVTGGLSQPMKYDMGDITWFFDQSDKTLTIENNVDVFNTYNIPTFIKNQGGTYKFEIIKENNIDYLVVDNRKGSIIFSDDGLMIDYGIAFDDIAYILKR